MLKFLHKIIPTKNERELKRIAPIVVQINGFEPAIKALSDDQIKSKTAEFKERIAKGETLDQLLPEAFAVVREVGRRTLAMRHFDVQLIGGVVLHEGRIAEMKTGEGKTLVATLPVYLNALSGKGVHVVTVNDYLARRDAEWMGAIYKFLGMNVGVIVHGLNDTERKWAYHADITYGTNNEFGFDYLRDNMKYSLENYVQRELNYAIVDEVDSILVDEARTPLIISGPSEESTDQYYRLDAVIPKLSRGEVIEDKKAGQKTRTGDFVVDEKSRTAVLTEQGVGKVEKILGITNLYDPENIEVVHHVNQSLRAHALYKKDVDYVVKDGKVLIVDEFTGRLMPGRRWSDGLHQAVEAKEKAEIENENQTLATITFQNFFRMYKKLAGMTGTADTEAPEFAKIYNLEVMVMPTHLSMIRNDLADVIYRTEREKFNQVVEDIKVRHQRGQPVLVGTISIEKSELLSGLLKRQGIAHHVLNAKQHEREAEIVAQAGRYRAVTISTNMAGRGTDIILGGNPEFLARSKVDREKDPEGYAKILEECRKSQAEERAQVLKEGGLHILGTERHESRRIDNQLRGRSGRQGDPGSSQFFLSLEDDLMRIFGSERISGLMQRLGMEENEPIIHPWITRAIENAQKKVEAHNFELRKHLLEYDDVMNQQRKTVYGLRRLFLEGSQLVEKVLDLIDQEVTSLVATLPEKSSRREELELGPVEERIFKLFDWKADWEGLELWNQETVGRTLYDRLEKLYREREALYPAGLFPQAAKVILLSTLDALWKDHLFAMDHLREGIGLRGYGQKDPLLEYKREGYQYFQSMIAQFREDAMEKIFHVRISTERSVSEAVRPRMPRQMMMGRGPSPSAATEGDQPAPDRAFARASQPPPKQEPIHAEKVGRNDPCPCGAKKPDGTPKKYKHCHGATA